jgi:hypothetical protein
VDDADGTEPSPEVSGICYASSIRAGHLFPVSFLRQKSIRPSKTRNLRLCEGAPYNGSEAVSALVEIFDRIYTTPLFGWRAMTRSAVLSICVTALVIFEFRPLAFRIGMDFPELGRQWLEFFAYNIVSDYAGLFIIRMWLRSAGRHPVFALFVGALLGLITVFAVYIFIDVVTFSIMTRTFHPMYFWQDVANWYYFMTTRGGFNRAFIGSAFLVYSWLLLFALSILFVQAINYLRIAIRFTQWFLKRGREHPLQAIGYVAAVFTFLIASTVSVLLARA